MKGGVLSVCCWIRAGDDYERGHMVGEQMVGVFFPDVDIDPGTKILNAYILFEVDEFDDGGSMARTTPICCWLPAVAVASGLDFPWAACSASVVGFIQVSLMTR